MLATLFLAPRSAAIGKFSAGFLLNAHQEGSVDYTWLNRRRNYGEAAWIHVHMRPRLCPASALI
jgi:hypothetical protein